MLLQKECSNLKKVIIFPSAFPSVLVEPRGQSPCLHAEVRFGTQAWRLTNARAGRHLPCDVGTSPPKIGALIHGRPAGGGTVAGGTFATLEWRDERRDMAVQTEKEIQK